MRNKYLLIGFLLCWVTNLWAQHTISGVVYDEDKNPLMGATVLVKEYKNVGASTDAKGYYKIVIPQSSSVTLSVSFIGYKAQNATFQPKKKNTKNFYLKEDEELLSEVVVTGTRTPKLLKDVPILTRVITADDIQKVNATHIGDLLQEELPGIEFSYSMNQQVSLNMQGFGGNSVLFLIDGERIAGETLDNIDYSRLNLDNVERIEIVKGAVSSLYGSNAVGGVINLISKVPKKTWTTNLNSFWGAHNEQRYGGSLGLNKGKFNNVFNMQYHETGAINLKNEGAYDKIYGNKSWNFKDRLIFTPVKDLKFTGKAGYFFRERDSKPEVKERYRGFNGGLKGNYHFADNNDIELSYTFDQYDKSDYGLASRMDVRDYSNVQHVFHALYNHSFNKNILTVGADFMHDYLMSYQFTDKGSHKQNTTDIFGQFDWHVTDKFNMITGLRYDAFSEADINHVSPSLGLMYKFNNNCTLRGSYAGGFRAPTLKEMYMTFNMANIFMIYGNPELKSESSHNFSVSAEYLKSNYNVTVNGFYNLVDNRITTAWNKAKNGMVYTNMAKLQVAGAEVNACARYSCGVSTRLSYSYTHEHIKKGQPLLSTTRPHALTAKVEYGKDWKNYGFNVSLNGRFLSKLTTDEYTQQNSYEETEEVSYPAYTMWKLNLTQRVWKGISVTCIVDNLFNYVPGYYYSNSPSTTGTTISAGLSIDLDKMF